MKVFLYVKENLKVIRCIKWDWVECNYLLDDVLYWYEYYVLLIFEKYIKFYVEEVDLIINNNIGFDMGMEVLVGFFCVKLDELKF